MPQLLCVKCQTEFRPVKNEVYVVEMASFGPYKLWMADAWGCPSCGHEVITGYGVKPVAEHYQPQFEQWLERLKTNGSRIEYSHEPQ